MRELGGCMEAEAREVCSNLHTCAACSSLDKCYWNSEKQCRERQAAASTTSTGGNGSEEGGERKEAGWQCPVPCSARTRQMKVTLVALLSLI